MVPTPAADAAGSTAAAAGSPTTSMTSPTLMPSVLADALVEHVPRGRAELGLQDQAIPSAEHRQPDDAADEAVAPSPSSTERGSVRTSDDGVLETTTCVDATDAPRDVGRSRRCRASVGTVAHPSCTMGAMLNRSLRRMCRTGCRSVPARAASRSSHRRRSPRRRASSPPPSSAGWAASSSSGSSTATGGGWPPISPNSSVAGSIPPRSTSSPGHRPRGHVRTAGLRPGRTARQSARSRSWACRAAGCCTARTAHPDRAQRCRAAGRARVRARPLRRPPRVLVVDDVVTTGATLPRPAALLAAGAARRARRGRQPPPVTRRPSLASGPVAGRRGAAPQRSAVPARSLRPVAASDSPGRRRQRQGRPSEPR